MIELDKRRVLPDEPAMDTIRRRVSCRDFRDEPLAPELTADIRALLTSGSPGPFGNAPRFALLEAGDGAGTARSGRLGTYGFIRNAHAFVAGAAKRADGYLHDYGYCLEWIVLELTRRGLGTCWLSGTFDRRRVVAALGLEPGEVVPAVTPVGIPTGRTSLPARAMKVAVRSASRKPWSKLFYETATGLPLAAPDQATAYREALAAVRLAPSAANRQPWRLYVDPAAAMVDFFSAGDPRMDLGIAMLHFELVALESGLDGGWQRDKPGPSQPGLKYVVTWRGTASP